MKLHKKVKNALCGELDQVHSIVTLKNQKCFMMCGCVFLLLFLRLNILTLRLAVVCPNNHGFVKYIISISLIHFHCKMVFVLLKNV